MTATVVSFARFNTRTGLGSRRSTGSAARRLSTFSQRIRSVRSHENAPDGDHPTLPLVATACPPVAMADPMHRRSHLRCPRTVAVVTRRYPLWTRDAPLDQAREQMKM